MKKLKLEKKKKKRKTRIYFEETDFNIFEKAQIVLELIFNSNSEKKVKEHFKSLKKGLEACKSMLDPKSKGFSIICKSSETVVYYVIHLN